MNFRTNRLVLYATLLIAIGSAFVFYRHLEKSVRESAQSQSKPCSHIPERFKSCVRDSDCAIVGEGCCSCAGWGRQCSINRRYVQEHNKFLNKVCSGFGCFDALSKDPSCKKGVKTRCLSGSCQLTQPS